MKRMASRTGAQAGALFLMALSLFALVGCGGPKIPVTGKVTYKGEPLGGVEIQFTSEEDAEAIYPGTSDEKDGTFVLDTRGKGGIPPGKYKVTVVWWLQANGKPIPGGEEGENLKEEDKARQYRSTFSKTIDGENAAFDLEVTEGDPQQIEE